MFGDVKKAAADAKVAIAALTVLTDRLEGLVLRLEATTAQKQDQPPPVVTT